MMGGSAGGTTGSSGASSSSSSGIGGMAPLSQYSGMRDMFDGGGPGQSGPTFQGGPFGISEMLNGMGVHPLGYQSAVSGPSSGVGGVTSSRGAPHGLPQSDQMTIESIAQEAGVSPQAVADMIRAMNSPVQFAEMMGPKPQDDLLARLPTIQPIPTPPPIPFTGAQPIQPLIPLSS